MPIGEGTHCPRCAMGIPHTAMALYTDPMSVWDRTQTVIQNEPRWVTKMRRQAARASG